MWQYVQKTGVLSRDGTYVDTGYSGSGVGKNNPSKECESNVGPIPRGQYTIGAEIAQPTVVTLPLAAANPNYCNPPRSGFLIHGDNTTGTASTGCIVLRKTTRERIRDSGDNQLTVIDTVVRKPRRKKKAANKKKKAAKAGNRKKHF
jgi:hypothetical protein